ncbi:MAG: DEAD/DEAH box helicase family protein [Eggerthella lenta]
MGAVDLRPYQEEARRAVEREWDEGRAKTLLVLPTGCGKTIVFAMVAKDVVDGGGRVLVLAHRGELLDQAADKIGKATGLGCSVEKAERTSVGEWFRVTVGSVQTMMRLSASIGSRGTGSTRSSLTRRTTRCPPARRCSTISTPPTCSA